jgi:hypothetical protein
LKVVGAVLRHAKYLDHLTLYHDLFGRSEIDTHTFSTSTLLTPGSLQTPNLVSSKQEIIEQTSTLTPIQKQIQSKINLSDTNLQTPPRIRQTSSNSTFFSAATVTKSVLPSDISEWKLIDILSLNWDATSLKDKEISLLSSHLTKITQKAGTYLSAGLDCAYIVLSGRVDFVQETNNFTDVVGFRTVGQPIGFTSVLCGLPILPKAFCPVYTVLLR